jgi:hypothetical protein
MKDLIMAAGALWGADRCLALSGVPIIATMGLCVVAVVAGISIGLLARLRQG